MISLACGAVLGAVGLGLWLGGAAAAPKNDAPPPAVPVSAQKAESRDMPVYVRGIGTVQAANAVSIKTRVDGQIVKVDFTEGQELKAGAPLFEIDPRPYQAALDQANAAKAKDQAQLASASADLKRDELLLARDFQTRQAYDQQKALVGQVQAAIAGDDAQIQTAQLNFNYATIRSPIDGRAGARLVDIGNLVHAADNAVLVSVVQLRPIYVSFTEPQSAFESIRASQAKTAIDTTALTPDDKKTLAQGKLSLIDNQIDQASGTIHLKAQFPNADEALWPGEFVNLQLTVDTLKNAVTVPTRTVQQGPDGPYLFVVKDDMTVENRNVTIAETVGDTVAISKGLAAGETVVVDGQYRLDQGTRVSLEQQPPAAAAPPAAAGG
jgi:multidrug efflux system membrane fusion protein